MQMLSARAVSLALLVLLTPGAARAQPLRVLVSNGLREAFAPVTGAAETATGRPVAVSYGTAVQLQARIEAGEAFDAALLPRKTADLLAAQGKLAGVTDFGRAQVGVEIRGDAPANADATTPAGIRKLMLGARQIRYLAGGASSVTILNMIERLGIAGALAGRTVTDSSDLTFPSVAGPGEYELLFNLNSELKPVNGWRSLGLVPQDYQVPVIETVGVASGTDATAAFVRFLEGPVFRKSMIDSGLEP